MVVVLMPSERQAISSSRSASQARPIGSRLSRSVTKLVRSASPEDQIEKKHRAVDRRIGDMEDRGEAVILVIERNAEETNVRNAGDAGVAVGQVDPVDEDEADDLAEGERDDRDVLCPILIVAYCLQST